MKKRRFILAFMIIVLIGIVHAENLEIKIKGSYYPGDEISSRIILYDDQNNQIQGKISFEIQNFYKEIIKKGEINSGEEITFKLPEDSIRGHWGIIARYNDLEKKELFNVLELEKARIKLEGDKLIVTNIGNVPYRKPIQIEIGGNKETALVPLGLGESKEIRLTAPDGRYDIKVSDGTEDNELVFTGVQLTGNVIGLEKTSKSGFLNKYPLVSLFLVVIILAAAVSGVRFLKNRKK